MSALPPLGWGDSAARATEPRIVEVVVWLSLQKGGHKSITLDMEESNTFFDVKAKIKEMEGIEPHTLVLRRLDQGRDDFQDAATLSEAGFMAGCQVQMHACGKDDKSLVEVMEGGEGEEHEKGEESLVEVMEGGKDDENLVEVMEQQQQGCRP